MIDYNALGLRRVASSQAVARRATTLDPPLFRRYTRKAAPMQTVTHRADPGAVASLLSALVEVVEGRPLAQILPAAPGLASDRLGISADGEFRDAILTALYTTVSDLGRTVTAPRARGEPAPVRTQLAARAIGVSAGTVVTRTTPRLVRRFDEFAAMFSDGLTLGAVLADGFDGLPLGTQETLSAFVTAIRNNLIAGDLEGARRAGEDLGILLVALHQAVQEMNPGSLSQRAQRGGRTRRPIRRSAPTHEMRQRAGNKVTTIEVDGDSVPMDEVTFVDGRPVRRRSRGR